MKRLPTTYRKYYPMLRLYRDDLESIVAILKENCDRVKLEAEGYELLDISDITQLQESQHLEEFTQCRVNSWVETSASSWKVINLTLELRSGTVPSLYLSDDSDTKLYGAAQKIDSILSARRNRTLDAFTSTPAIIIPSIFCFAMFVFGVEQRWHLRLLHPTPVDVGWFVFTSTFFLLGVAPLFISTWLRKRYVPLVYLTNSHAHKLLTRVQRKQLIRSVIVYVLGVFSAFIAQLIFWLLTR